MMMERMTKITTQYSATVTKDVEHDHMDNVIPAVHSVDEENVERSKVLAKDCKFGTPEN